jgi:hypothetical protein
VSAFAKGDMNYSAPNLIPPPHCSLLHCDFDSLIVFVEVIEERKTAVVEVECVRGWSDRCSFDLGADISAGAAASGHSRLWSVLSRHLLARVD